MYVELYELPLKINGLQFFVQWEIEEQHYRIEFVGNNAGKPMLIMRQDDNTWLDLEDRNHLLAEQIGKMISGNLTEQETKYAGKKSV